MKIPSLGILPVADAQPEPVDYIGICEASAAVALDDSHFVVASDETNTFQIYRRGIAKPVQALQFKSFIGNGEIRHRGRRPHRRQGLLDQFVLAARRRRKRQGPLRSLRQHELSHTPDGPTLEPLGTPFEGLRGYLKTGTAPPRHRHQHRGSCRHRRKATC